MLVAERVKLNRPDSPCGYHVPARLVGKNFLPLLARPAVRVDGHAFLRCLVSAFRSRSFSKVSDNFTDRFTVCWPGAFHVPGVPFDVRATWPTVRSDICKCTAGFLV